jgi:hypothetical protein
MDIYYQNSFLSSTPMGYSNSVEPSSFHPSSFLETGLRGGMEHTVRGVSLPIILHAGSNFCRQVPKVTFPAQEMLPQDSLQYYCAIMHEDTIKGDEIFFRKVCFNLLSCDNAVIHHFFVYSTINSLTGAGSGQGLRGWGNTQCY